MGEQRFRRSGLGADDRTSGAEDARLFARDVLARRSEIVHVVEIDAGDDGDVGVDDVDRVETAAQAHFEHDGVGRGGGEEPQCGERAVLEIRERNLGARVLDRVESGDERVIG